MLVLKHLGTGVRIPPPPMFAGAVAADEDCRGAASAKPVRAGGLLGRHMFCINVIFVICYGPSDGRAEAVGLRPDSLPEENALRV